MSDIAELIEWYERMRTEDRRRVAAKVAAACAHDVGTPLNVVAGRLSLAIAREVESQDVRAAQHAAHKLSARIQSRLEQTRYRAPVETVELRETSRAVCERLQPLAIERGIELRVTGETSPCRWNHDTLQSVLSAWIMAGLINGSEGALTVAITSLSLDRGQHGVRPGRYHCVSLSLAVLDSLDPTLLTLSEEAMEGFEGWFGYEAAADRIDLSFNIRSSR